MQLCTPLCGVRFAHEGGVPASQSDSKQKDMGLHASMTPAPFCFESAVNCKLPFTVDLIA
jgi:hypothetical protein